MTQFYGPAWIESGSLTLKYLGPVFTGDEVVVSVGGARRAFNEPPERARFLIRVTRVPSDEEKGVTSIVAGGNAGLGK
jgi:hypothetical protein